jgi:hypothetical protein
MCVRTLLSWNVVTGLALTGEACAHVAPTAASSAVKHNAARIPNPHYC